MMELQGRTGSILKIDILFLQPTTFCLKNRSGCDITGNHREPCAFQGFAEKVGGGMIYSVLIFPL